VKRAALALLIIVSLTGCSSISSGTITAKTVEPPYTWIQYICSGYNSQGICTVQVPIFHNEPEKYRFDIEERDDTGWVYVGYSVFQQYEIGDYYEGGN